MLRQTLRDLVLATWEVDAQQVAEALPRGLEPQLAAGRALVSVVGARVRGPRFGHVPAPGWSQISVRTYVIASSTNEAGVYLWLSRASFPGGVGAAFGIPLRTTVVRVDASGLEAPGVGLVLRTRTADGAVELPDTSPQLGEHDVAFFPRWGNARKVGRFVARHAPMRWQQAELVAPPRLDPLLALGFDLELPRWCLYAPESVWEIQLPPRPVRL